MVMGVKMQVVLVRQAADLLEITLNHLDTVRKLVLHSDKAVVLVDSLIDFTLAVSEGVRLWCRRRSHSHLLPISSPLK